MKNKKSKIIVLIIGIIIVAVVLFLILGNGKKEENNNEQESTNSVAENIKENNDNDENNEENKNEWKDVEGLQIPEKETDTYSILNFGIRNNIFVEDVLVYGNKELKNTNEANKIKEYLTNLSNKNKNELTSNDNEGIIYQRVFYMYKDEDLNCYILSSKEAKVICDLEYFKNNAFNDYKKMKNKELNDEDGYSIFTNEMQEEYPKLNIEYSSYEETEELYFSLEGDYLENDYDEMKKMLGVTDNDEETDEEEQVEEVDEEQGVEIIEEEDSEEEGIVDEEDVAADVEIVEVDEAEDDTEEDMEDEEEIIEEDDEEEEE